MRAFVFFVSTLPAVPALAGVEGGEYRLGLELITDPADVGQVVGRSGHLTTSLRSFLSALAGKHKIKIDFDYVTEEDNARREASGELAGRDLPYLFDKRP